MEWQGEGPVGSCPLMVRDNRHVSAYLFGAICPDRAVGAALVMPYVNAEAMNEHLKDISINVAPGAPPCWSATVQAGTKLAGSCMCLATSRCCACRPTRQS